MHVCMYVFVTNSPKSIQNIFKIISTVDSNASLPKKNLNFSYVLIEFVGINQ